MFLKFGLNGKNQWVGIEETASGKSSLICPFCKQPLIARKGKINEHHFAHQGHTCRVSELAVKKTQLPTVDNFELLDSDERKYLERRRRYQHRDIFSWGGERGAVERLEAMQILSVEYEHTESQSLSAATANLRALRKGYIDEAGRPSQALLDIFKALEPISGKVLADCWLKTNRVINTKVNRSYYANKLNKLSSFGQFESAQRYWFDAYYRKISLTESDFLPLLNAKLSALNEQTLYVFRFEVDFDGCPESIVKIGMTTRKIEQRLKEVTNMLKVYGEVKSGNVMATKDHCGRLERLLHLHYAEQQITLERHREFFDLSASQLQKLVTEIEKVGDIECYSPPIIEQSNQINVAGRKKKSNSELLAEYPTVVDCLTQGLGIRPTAREAGVSVNTVQKVRAALPQKDRDF